MDLTTDECIICYEPLGIITNIEITSCFHMLHQTCLTRWLAQTPSCPMCRTSIPRVQSVQSYYEFNFSRRTFFAPETIALQPMSVNVFNRDMDGDDSYHTIIPEPVNSDWRINSTLLARDRITHSITRSTIQNNIEYWHVAYRRQTAFEMESDNREIPSRPTHHYIENRQRVKHDTRHNTNRNHMMRMNKKR